MNGKARTTDEIPDADDYRIVADLMRPDELTSGADRPYWSSLLTGEVRLPRCCGCGAYHWPAVWRCSSCGGWGHDWVEVSLKGEIYSWTRTWHAFSGAEAFSVPFVSIVVALDEADGARLIGTLEGADDTVAIGDRVTGRVDHIEMQGSKLPALRWTVQGQSA